MNKKKRKNKMFVEKRMQFVGKVVHSSPNVDVNLNCLLEKMKTADFLDIQPRRGAKDYWNAASSRDKIETIVVL